MISMVRCKSCNANVSDNANFCVECGSSLTIQQKIELPENYPSIKSLIGSNDLETFRNLNAQLRDLETIDEELARAKTHYNGILRQVRQLENEYENVRNQVKEEFQDLAKLQKTSWTSFMASLKGDKDTRLEKEEQEYLVAVQKQEAVEDSLEKNKQELQQARVELNTVEQLVARKESLVREIHALVNRVMGGVAHPEEDKVELELKSKQQQLEPKLHEKTQLDNAMASIKRALLNYQNADSILGDAMGLANWDTFFGGGMFMDSIKHSRFREARNYVYNANDQLQSAYRYYPSLPRVQGLHVDQGGGEFFDIFFDNIFSDMAMRRRIGETRDQVRMKLHQVQDLQSQTFNLLQNCDQEYRQILSDIQKLEEELISLRLQIMEDAVNTSKKK